MEHGKMSVNDILSEEITKLNYTLIPPGFHGDTRTVRLMQDSLSKMIDHLGVQSATEQGLRKVITTSEILRSSPNYILYVLKDPHAKNGEGELIGILKVGCKHLYLFDERNSDRVHEVEPLCVLDFFVVSDRQRHGYGRKLFDHMLKDMKTSAHEMAVDGPSSKMEQFLIKTYDMPRIVRQSNNFAVSPLFFDNLGSINRPTEATPVVTPGVGRYTAPRPPSAIGNVIHGAGSAVGDKDLSSAFAEASIRDSAARSQWSHTPMVAERELPRSATPPEPARPASPPAERPRTLHVDSVATALSPASPSPAGSSSSRRVSQLTDQGYFDVKFYHNKLW